jgi:carbamoyltransferase
MIILGINYSSHGSSSAIVQNGIILAASSEERFDRIKYSDNFPMLSIKFCLDKVKKDINELNEICISMNFLKRAKFKFNLESSFEQICYDVKKQFYVENKLRQKFGYKGQVKFLDHHDCHASACYFTSPFKNAAIITVDGAGEEDATRIYKANENSLEKIFSFKFPNSLGALYSLVTSYLGFKIDADEGKIMGLAPYGNKDLVKKFKKIIDIDKKGYYQIKDDWLDFNNESFHEEFSNLLGFAEREKQEIGQNCKNLAFAVQSLLEEAIISLAKASRRITGESQLCLGGGVALNSVANGKIIQEKIFDDVFLYPASGDDGTAVGAALYSYYSYQSQKSFYKINQSPYLGYSTSEKEIIDTLNYFKLKYEKLKNSEIEKEIGKLIAENNIVGHFAGRAEFGPRALGNRSILANPIYYSNKDRINNNIKFREKFRPFAPVILQEYSEDYFNMHGFESPYMILAFKVKEDAKKFIPATIHIDNTARVQTIKKNQNERLWNIIKGFYDINQVPVLLNTSFNRAGEAIVNTPKEAIKTFLNSDIDILVLERFLVKKSDLKI